MIISRAHLALTWLVGITFAGLLPCLTIYFPGADLISTKNISGSCPIFNLKAFQRQQLYELWSYVGSIIICPFVYNPIYSSSNWSFSKVHLNLNVTVYGSFMRPFMLMKSISYSWCLTLGYVAWSWFVDSTISWPFDTWQITTMNVLFGLSGRLLLAMLLARSPKSVSGPLLPLVGFFLASQISHAHFCRNGFTNCERIHSALSKLSKGNQVLNVFKIFPTTVSQCRGQPLSCFNQFCPQIID
jgi:hypothetical protein